eukprot:CAMPEP_0194396004 /NCGR_PEP_ID=MMETSP0174-20130528/124741_1 /TAXON_ID=216777 /ORGANISM="Proboscia alata, Strain PI-D3" /LENGTH=97 /DNA_ID=CAMNT_0039192009 /DNA_START=247 /DNA_END=540 /DNA_ORIENTATION=-
MTSNPNFTPASGSPTVEVNVRTTTPSMGNTLSELRDEHEQQQRLSEEGKKTKTYEFGGVVSYEFDVVGCESFVEDTGCWIRNMPDEIRVANPEFVPR